MTEDEIQNWIKDNKHKMVSKKGWSGKFFTFTGESKGKGKDLEIGLLPYPNSDYNSAIFYNLISDNKFIFYCKEGSESAQPTITSCNHDNYDSLNKYVGFKEAYMFCEFCNYKEEIK